MTHALAPDADRDAVLQQARDLRASNRIPEALNLLARLEVTHPRFSRLHHERGHCHVLLRDAHAAVEALQHAVTLNPTLPACWDMLEQLYRMQGDTARAGAAAQKLAVLRQLPPAVVVANSLYADGDLAPAEHVLRDFLRTDGGNVGALRLLARVRMDRGALAEAEDLLARLLEHAPDYHAARQDYAMALLQQQKHAQARREAERLLVHEPHNRAYLKQYGAACVGMGDHEPVIDIYAELLADQEPAGVEVADLRVWRANALKIAGRQSEAIADYRAALAAHPDYGVAWFGLANLKTYRFTDEDIARMRAAESRPDLHGMDRVYLCFALGQAFEDRKDYASSWQYLERGNALRSVSARYRPEGAQACAGRLAQTFTADFFATRAGWGVDDPDPIFILGLPRSGSTLIEQVLASHSRVEGTQELTEIGRYAGELCGIDPECGLPLHPAALLELTAQDARALGERYLAETRVYRRGGKPVFIDKMPNNFWHIGLIHLILPKARIIDMRREPMACCFSNFKQLFGTSNQEFTYGLADMAHHYRVYLSMMRHWDAILPGRVLRVHYEDVVEDLEGTVRRLLDHCGLPFESACLTYHETRRSVRTPSSEQVRQPISRAGLDQWQHYAPMLTPLEEVLGDALTEYRI